MARILVGRSFGSYHIDDVLGTGATSTVYAAFNRSGRRIALKVLSGFAMGNAEMRRAIHREYWSMRGLDHPHVPRVHRMGTIAEVLYIEMELVDGPTLSDLLRGGSAHGSDELISIGAEVARTLQHSHDRRIVHRDVKPSNIMIVPDRGAMLFDFGLSQNSADPDAQPGRIYGTPGYLSPEQALAEGLVDGRADLYSLGATLFHAATGKAPFVGERIDMLRGHVEEEPPQPSSLAVLPADLETVILTAMEKQPESRYQSGDEMADALEAVDHEELIGPQRRGLFRRKS